MTVRAATPYLIMKGRAEQAIALYQRALGAKVHDLKRFGEVDQSCPAANKELVMHAELRIDATVLMLSDGPGRGECSAEGDISIALDFDGRQAAQHAFDALAEGGKVIQKLFEAPWGGTFGALVDSFGVSWMFTSPVSG